MMEAVTSSGYDTMSGGDDPNQYKTAREMQEESYLQQLSACEANLANSNKLLSESKVYLEALELIAAGGLRGEVKAMIKKINKHLGEKDND
jgi:hypothetical protein